MLIENRFFNQHRCRLDYFRNQEKAVERFYNTNLLQVGTPTEDQSWSNIIEHNQTVAKRCLALGRLLQFPCLSLQQLAIGALLHDGAKRQEIEYIKKHGKTWEAFDAAYRQATALLQEAGFHYTLIQLADSVGHDSLLGESNIAYLADRPNDNLWEEMRLVIHYVDDFTLKADPVQPADQGKNDFDRRMDANESNPNYQAVNEAGRRCFGGKTAYEAQRQVGKKIETLLTQLVNQRNRLKLDPLDLPYFIHQKVAELESQATSA